MSGKVTFNLGILKPGEVRSLDFEIYAGPKDYKLLTELGSDQNKVMQFGVFWWVSEPLSYLLDLFSGMLGSYGLGIIVLTILMKLILWPLTAKLHVLRKRCRHFRSLWQPYAKSTKAVHKSSIRR